MLERTILLDGFSKTYAMTGWRLGYGLFPAPLIPHVSRLIINSVSCTSSLQPEGRCRGHHRPAGRSEADARRVPAAAASWSSAG